MDDDYKDSGDDHLITCFCRLKVKLLHDSEIMILRSLSAAKSEFPQHSNCSIHKIVPYKAICLSATSGAI